MRIVSLVPHATELLFALGLGDQVVGVTHECDHPTEALERPHVTTDRLPPGLSAAEIDAAVRERTERGEAIYDLDAELLAELEPDLIVTQALCPVCAVSYDDVQAIAARMDPAPKVIALDPKTFGETINDIRTVSDATGAKEAAFVLIATIARRVEAVKSAVADAEPVPVAALEWLDPPFAAGHWTPQLIEMAGGFDVLGLPGESSEQVTWEMVRAAEPEVVVCMPCGYDLGRAHEEAEAYAAQLGALGARRVVAIDASGTFSRPGPRLVEALELMAHVLHPDRVPEAPSAALDVEGAAPAERT
ncbi:cobalamin-binding protein [Capillimicrobium parvum]|uniref:cobalamin-binding protein n=1 Tax=Capillimicrobium parvum TaxID=2884022 RepID=UPI00216B0252|nr:cobalamin-binding protein [Capillimicrobium parvum]